MRIRLKDAASIQAGYSFRARLEPVPDGEIAVIQMKDLSDDNIVETGSLVRVNIDSAIEKHLVKVNDLIFRSRGQLSTSAILLTDIGPAVVAAPLLRIRVSGSAILPQYLNWYISQRPAEIFLAKRSEGSSVKMISKETLENLVVDLPSLDRQRAIIDLADLAKKEQDLLQKIAKRKDQYIGCVLTRAASAQQSINEGING